MFGNLLSIDSLFDDFRRLQRELSSNVEPWPGRPSIRAVARGSFPPINIGSSAEAVQVYLFAPGLDTEKLDLSIEQNLLTVSGERNTPGPEHGKAGNYHLRERSGGKFRRVLSLPEDVDPDRVEARYQNGVLHITLARRESARPRQIEIKSV